MANDYPAVVRAVRLATTGEPPALSLAPMDAALSSDLSVMNQQFFGSSTPTAPMTPANFNLVNTVAALIVNPQSLGGIFTLQQALREAAMALKLTFAYTDGIQGFSEVHYLLSGSPSGLSPAGLGQYVNLRLAFSGQQTQFKRVRVNDITSRFSVATYTAQQLATYLPNGNSGYFRVGGLPQDSDSPDSALIINCTNNTDNRTRRMFMRGIPDSVNQRGGQFVDPGGFVTAFNAWVTYIVGQSYGWEGQPVGGSPRVPIVSLTSVQGQIAFVLGDAIAWPAVNVNTPVRVRGLPSPARYLNGPLVVLPTDGTHCTTIRLFSAPPAGFQPGSAAQMYLQKAANFYPYQFIGIDPQIGERKAGRPFGQARGRSRNRVTA